ncbi:Sec1 domain-containing protein 2 [Coemansia sp. BCRC 34301]|nr:Sec1 domain-containing protein 2 [Coemansia sp. BCRC 34301]
MSTSLAEQVAAALLAAVDRHSLGLETTIYADEVVLQCINASVPGGILGLLGSASGKVCARTIKQLDAPLSCLPDGTHALFLLGGVSWPMTAWSSISQILQRGAFTKCTLCVSTSERLWHDMEAAFPGHLVPLTSSGVSMALLELLRRGQHAGSEYLEPAAVQVHALPLISVASLYGDCFVLPDAHDEHTLSISDTEHLSDAGRGAAWDTKILDRISLNIVSLLHGLGLEGSFYSLGDMAKRVSRKCTGLAQRSREHGNGERATVVIVDRALDLVAPTHHGGHLLDQLLRAMPGTASSSADALTSHSLLSVLREDGHAAMSLWETCFEQDKSVALQTIRHTLVGRLAEEGGEGKVGGSLPSTTGKVTTEQLQSILDIYRDVEETDQVDGALRIARAVVDSASIGERERWSETESAEKTLKLVIGGVKDSLLEQAKESDNEEEEEEEMSAVWDQVLASIPSVTLGMLETYASSSVEEEDGESALTVSVSRWLWRHTPAPGMLVMAASLLAPSRVGIPAGQRAQAERRLVDDYTAVYRVAAAHGQSDHMDAGVAQRAAERWSGRIMDYVERVVVSEGQRARMTQWRELAGLSRGTDGVYSPLVAQVADGMLRGDRCADLEFAEQGAAMAAANLLKGLG